MRKTIFFPVIAILALSCSGNPGLLVEPEVHNAGELAPHEKIVTWFTFSNTGGSDLIIENVRSLCDCITVDSIPESIAPGGKDSIRVTYIAPDSAGPDRSALMVRTNSEPKNTKLIIESIVLKAMLTLDDSSVVVVPFQNVGVPGGSEFTMQLFKHLVENLPAGFEPVNPNSYTKKIQNDPKYNVDPLHDVARKWCNLTGIRFAVFGEVKKSAAGEGVDMSLMVVDGLFHLPMGRLLNGIPEEQVPSSCSDTLNAILSNLREYEKQAFMAELQQKWAKQRAELLNKPAPDIVAEDVRSGETISLKSFAGKPLVLQFFSTDCDHCEEEMNWLSELVTAHPEIAALGISVDVGERDSVISYIQDKNLKYPVILPSEENEAQLDPYYGGATPQTVIVSPEGIVIQSLVGFSRGAMASFEKMLLAMVQKKSGDAQTQ